MLTPAVRLTDAMKEFRSRLLGLLGLPAPGFDTTAIDFSGFLFSEPFGFDLVGEGREYQRRRLRASA